MAPYASESQRRFFHAAEKRGEISHRTVAEYDRASKGKNLPERVNKTKKESNEMMHYGRGGSQIHRCVDRVIGG